MMEYEILRKRKATGQFLSCKAHSCKSSVSAGGGIPGATMKIDEFTYLGCFFAPLLGPSRIITA